MTDRSQATVRARWPEATAEADWPDGPWVTYDRPLSQEHRAVLGQGLNEAAAWASAEWSMRMRGEAPWNLSKSEHLALIRRKHGLAP